jgi:hypothetical protein
MFYGTGPYGTGNHNFGSGFESGSKMEKNKHKMRQLEMILETENYRQSG